MSSKSPRRHYSTHSQAAIWYHPFRSLLRVQGCQGFLLTWKILCILNHHPAGSLCRKYRAMKAPSWSRTPQPRNMKIPWSAIRLKSAEPHPPADGVLSASETSPSSSQMSLRLPEPLWKKTKLHDQSVWQCQTLRWEKTGFCLLSFVQAFDISDTYWIIVFMHQSSTRLINLNAKMQRNTARGKTVQLAM